MPTPVTAIVLAAGQGTRMRSALPKVLHPCAGLPMVGHVVRLALKLGANPVVVVVSPTTHAPVEQALRALLPDAPLRFAVQEQPRGTGDAVRAGLTAVPDGVAQALLLYGDVPLLTRTTLDALAEAGRQTPLALLTCEVDDPTGYGRVVRDGAGQVQRIVEHKDCDAAQRQLREVNVGVYWSAVDLLRRAVGALDTRNAQGELYLTDIVAAAAKTGRVAAVPVADVDEMRGVNSRVELGQVERIMRARLVQRHQLAGVTFIDPKRVYLGIDVLLAQDVTVGPDVQLLGQTKVGEGSLIDGPSRIENSTLEAHAHVRAFSHLEDAHVCGGAVVGPYARLRPGAHIGTNARVGNFVEVKNATLGAGAKANHLAYVGDAEVGAGANLGAGTITCNYDGFNKSRTRIGERAFVGSNSTLVAPLAVGADSFVAAGSVITQDVPPEALAFGRARQAMREGHALVLRQRMAKKKADAQAEAAKNPAESGPPKGH